MSHRTLLAAGLILAVIPLLAPASAPRRARALLRSTTVARGTANYQDRMRDGQRDQRFIVQVTRQQPFRLLPVRVNGRTAGTVFTNPLGAARLNLRTSGIGPADPLPANFRRLRTGDVITAGNMIGIVFQTTGGSFEATGEGTAGDGMFASALYQEQNAGAGAPIERHFEVAVTGGPSEQAIPIFINDVFIDTLFTDPGGNGLFEMSTTGLNDGDDALMPGDFPALVGGDVVDVGNATITLTQSSTPTPPPPGGGDGDDDSSDDGSSDDGSSDDGSSDDGSSDDGSSDDGSSDDGSSGGDDH